MKIRPSMFMMTVWLSKSSDLLRYTVKKAISSNAINWNISIKALGIPYSKNMLSPSRDDRAH